jgi:hypothetical protein
MPTPLVASRVIAVLLATTAGVIALINRLVNSPPTPRWSGTVWVSLAVVLGAGGPLLPRLSPRARTALLIGSMACTAIALGQLL